MQTKGVNREIVSVGSSSIKINVIHDGINNPLKIKKFLLDQPGRKQ